MNCPKCGWPGLIVGHTKRELAAEQLRGRKRMEDNAELRADLSALRFLIKHLLTKPDAEMRETLGMYLKYGWPGGGAAWTPPKTIGEGP